MKIAIPYENDQIFQHFGKTEQFKFYTVEQDKLTSYELVPAIGSGHDALSTFLLSHGIDTVVCGGIGGGAQQALSAAGIAIYGGVQGSCDLAVSNLLAGRLQPGVRDDACRDKGLDHAQHGHCGQHGQGGFCAHHDYVNNRHTCHGE